MKSYAWIDRKHSVFMKLSYKNNNTRIASKKIETYLKCMMPFPAMDEAPAYETGHLISPKKKTVQMITVNL